MRIVARGSRNVAVPTPTAVAPASIISTASVPDITPPVPMIGTEIVEVPNPRHPYGLRGVGEVPVVPTMAAIANAIGSCIGVRPQSLPMSPPRLLKLIKERGPRK